jgi:hypothetical protein
VGRARGCAGLLRGYGRSFASDHLRRGTPIGEQLRAVGDKLAAAASSTRDAQRATVASLDAEVARYESS